MQAANTMGYRPSRIAQALQGKSTQLIGVFMPDTDDFFFQTVVKHLRHTLEESDYELIVFVSPPGQIPQKWQKLLQWDLDGVFVFDYMFYVKGLWEALTQHSGAIPPVVGLFSNTSELDDYISLDFGAAMETLLAHLKGLGRKRFGYLALADSFQYGEQRYALFSEFVRRHGLEQCDIKLARCQESLMEVAKCGTEEWLKCGEPVPDALFCQNDELAIGAYAALREAGYTVPGQVALAGCDDLPYARFLDTPLTSVCLPVQEVCRQGWNLLQQRIAAPEKPPAQVVVEASLTLRASCAV